MRCIYNGSQCNAALVVFAEDDWLASTGQVGYLFDSLTWALRAAQEWQAQSELALGVDGYAPQVYAMDAVFLRARGLFEFFLGKGGNYCHAQCLFGLPGELVGPAGFAQWKNELHIGAMHLQNRRSGGPLPRLSGSGSADLNQMPADIAHGVLEVWKEFEMALASTGQGARHTKALKCRRQAMADSRRVLVGIPGRSAAYATKEGSASKLTALWGTA